MSFSLRGLLLTVPIIDLGVSGFVFASPWASNPTYTICMAVLFFAVVAVLFACSDRRLFWAGFAAFGWGIGFWRSKEPVMSKVAGLQCVLPYGL